MQHFTFSEEGEEEAILAWEDEEDWKKPSNFHDFPAGKVQIEDLRDFKDKMTDQD